MKGEMGIDFLVLTGVGFGVDEVGEVGVWVCKSNLQGRVVTQIIAFGVTSDRSGGT